MILCLWSYVHLPNPSACARFDTRVNFQTLYYRSEFRDFLRLDRLPSQVKDPSLPNNLPIPGGSCIQVFFFKGTSAMWNANSLHQDLNSAVRRHFLRRKHYTTCTIFSCIVWNEMAILFPYSAEEDRNTLSWGKTISKNGGVSWVLH